jgi:hypothetical protein
VITAALAFLKLAGGWLLGVLRSLPWWAWLVVALLAAGWLYGERQHVQGAAEVQARWDAAATIEAQQRRDLEVKQDKVTTKVEIQYRDRVQTVKVKGDTIIKEIVRYVPIDSPDLPPGFRVLHDAAAANELPDPAGIAYAAPVPAATVAETVAANYTGCHANAVAIEEWQNWANRQKALNP